MHFRLLTTCLSLLTVWLCLSSCQDHSVPQTPTQRFRLKRTSTTGLRSYAATVFNYGPDGRIASYVDYAGSSSGLPGHTIALSYDSQGRLSSAQGESIDIYPIRYTYSYDNQGNISSVKRYNDRTNSGNYVLGITYDLTYSSSRFPDKVSIQAGLDTGFPSSRSEQYTYMNGNVITTQDNYSTTPIVYSYTNGANPFYGLIYGEPNVQLYSKNLFFGSSYVDTYDANGLIVKRFSSGGSSSPQLNYTQTFDYEAY